MKKLLTLLRAIRPWQIPIFMVILVTSAGGTYGTYTWLTGSKQSRLADNQQLIPVQLGNFTVKVNMAGNVVFPNRSPLTFGSLGIVNELLVRAGQRVEKGDILARLDAPTVASLQKAVVEARQSLKKAQDALEQARKPFTAADIAQARLKVLTEESALTTAKEALAKAKSPYADADIATARIAVRTAEDALARAKSPYTDTEIATARIALTNNQKTLSSAQDDLANITIAWTRSLIATAQKTLATVRNDLSNNDFTTARTRISDLKMTIATMKSDLTKVKGSYSADEIAGAVTALDNVELALASTSDGLGSLSYAYLGKAQWLVEDAESALVKAIKILPVPKKLFGESDVANARMAVLNDQKALDKARSDLDMAKKPHTEAETASARIAVINDQKALDKARVDLVKANNPYTEADIASTRIATITAQKALDKAQADFLKASVSQRPDDQTQEQTQLQVVVAQANLQKSQADLNLILAGPDAQQVKLTEQQVLVAQTNLQKSQTDLDVILAGPDTQQVKLAEQQMLAAQANLQSAQKQLDLMLAGPNELEVIVAKSNLKKAQVELDRMLAGPDPQQVKLTEQQVVVAQANFDDAKRALELKLAGGDPLEIALREAEMELARVALDVAQKQVENAILKAPMAGIVSAVNIKPGQQVNANAVAMEIVDISTVDVNGVVNEIDVPFIREGNRASVSLDALRGQILEGRVTTIAAVGQSQQGVVNYQASIRLNVPQGVQLREGLSASASVVLREEQNVILVPQLAIYGNSQQPWVNVMANGNIREQNISLGDSDAFWVIVNDGLQPGDQLVVQMNRAAASQLSSGSQMRQAQQLIPGLPGATQSPSSSKATQPSRTQR